jgi:hypothetical protein
VGGDTPAVEAGGGMVSPRKGQDQGLGLGLDSWLHCFHGAPTGSGLIRWLHCFYFQE